MLSRHRTTHAVLASAIAKLATASLATAQERAGVVTTLEGKVTVVRAASPELTPLKFRDAIFVRDRIATGKESFARILLGGKAVVTIREFSAVTITEVPGVAPAAVSQGEVERAAKDRGGVAGAPVATAAASADKSAAQGKTAQSDQSGGDSDKGKSNQSGTATVFAGSGSSAAATRGGGASGGATVATAPPVSTGVVSTAPTVVPAIFTSSQGVTLK